MKKSRPAPQVVNYLSRVGSANLYLSVLTIGELRRGVLQLGKYEPKNAGLLASWLSGIQQDFFERILPIDMQVAEIWGQFSSERSRSVIDTLLAATAYVHAMTFVTRNIRHVSGLPIVVVNPWESGTRLPEPRL